MIIIPVMLLLLIFKPVRMIVGWLLFAVLCIGLYACAEMPPAHAQSSPMVQCQIGSWAQVMPDYACEAMEAGARKLKVYVGSNRVGDYTGIRACSENAAAQLGLDQYALMGECGAIWRNIQSDIAQLDRQNPSAYCTVIHQDGRDEEFRTTPSECQRRIAAAEHE
jgi:hypothetical protein